jgi:hypothetical protein
MGKTALRAAEGLNVGDAVVVSLMEPAHMLGEIVTGVVDGFGSDGTVDIHYEGLVDGKSFGNHEVRDVRKLDELDIAAAKPKVPRREMLERGQPPRLGEAGEKRMADVAKAGKFEWGKTPQVWSENSKLKLDKIASWGIPAYMTPAIDAQGNIELDKDGKPKWTTICKNAGHCALNYDCYALNGPQAFPSARLGSYQYRYMMTLQPEFVQKMDAYVKVRKAEGDKAIRVHDAGDFYSLKYLKDWYKVAELNPDMKFYAYTKMVQMAKSTEGERPKNWRWIFSFGGTQDHLIKESDFHSFPFDNLADLQAAGYADASESDAAAAFGDNNKIGLVVHNANKGNDKGAWHTYAPSWLKDLKKEEPPTEEPVKASIKAAAPYTAPAEKAGTSYKKSNKFLPREGLYNGKGAPKTLDPNDLTKPGAKAMPVNGPKRVKAGKAEEEANNLEGSLKALRQFFAEAGDVVVSFKVYENTKTPEDDVIQVWMKPEHADAVAVALQQAGFDRVNPKEGVFDRKGRNLKEAMQAFEGAVAVSGNLEIVERGANVLVLHETEPTGAPVRASRNTYAVPVSANTLPVFAMGATLPMFYRDRDGATLCPACATAHDWAGAKVVAADVNWEDDKLVCVNCDTRVPSAFAEAPAAVPAKLLAKMTRKGAQGFVAQSIKAAKLKLWKTPRDYAGEEYPDYYVGLSKHRDSDTLTRANFDAMLERLGGEDEAAGVIVTHASHWAVGWVETILVHKDSDKVAELQEMMNELEEYAVLDEDKLTEYEMEQEESDWENWGKGDVEASIMEALKGVEGVTAETFDELPEDLKGIVRRKFSESWRNSGGDISANELNKKVVEAVEAWVKAGPTRERQELEKAGQESLPGIKEQFGAALKKRVAMMAARHYMELHAADTWEGVDAPNKSASKSTSAPAEYGDNPRKMRVAIPAGDKDKLAQVKKYLTDVLDTIHDVNDTSDPMTVDVTFFPAAGALKNAESEDFVMFLRGLGLTGQWVRGRATGRPKLGIAADAMTFASLVHRVALTTTPQGDEHEASLYMSTNAALSPKLVLKQTKNGLVAECGRRRKTITASITPLALVAWAKEN